MTVIFAAPARAQNYKVLYSFTGGADGGQPGAGLISDAAGNLYGTTEAGGGILAGPCAPQGCGVVFKLDLTGNETVLYRFTGGADGGGPVATLVQDAAGNLYGTTSIGGGCSQQYSADGCGVVFKLDPTTGQETVLYSFTGGSDGGTPGPLLIDKAGILYGTTGGGGDASGECGAAGCGVVFKLDPSTSTYSVLYAFTGGADGGGPTAGLIQDSGGNLYGTTGAGGANVSVCGGSPLTGLGCGVVFKLDPSGTYTVLYAFQGQADGGNPVAPLIEDAAGNFYGTTENLGTYNWGVVFKLDASGNESVLHEFTGGADGATPRAGLISDAVGNLYGTASQGGTGTFFTNGVVFELNSAGVYIVLHTLAASGAEGMGPSSGLLMDSAGNLYGTASSGGPSCSATALSCGVVFEVTPAVMTNFNLSMVMAGNGNGTVTSNPAGIDCTGTTEPSLCSANFPNGTTVMLTASAPSGSGSTFAGWSGPCSGTGGCTIAGGASVTATFNQIPPDFSVTPASASLTLQPGGQGTDIITIAPKNNPLFGNAIQLSCTVTGPSPMPSCALSPSSVTPDWSSTTSTLTITVPTRAADRLRASRTRFPRSLYAFCLPVLISISITGLSRKKRARYQMLCGLLVLLSGFEMACGGSSSDGGGRGTTTSYTVTVTGTSSAIQHSAQLTVTIP